MPTITKLQNQENFDFGLSIIPLNPKLSENVPYVYEYFNRPDYAHLRPSTPELHSVQVNFKRNDQHYGSHQLNLLVSFYKYDVGYGDQIGILVHRLESPTLDISELYDDFQSNFAYEVGESFLNEHLDQIE